MFNQTDFATGVLGSQGYLLNENEVAEITEAPEGFVDRYTGYATERTDAPPLYHVAGALVMLSSIAGRAIYSPLLNLHSNLNMELLGDTGNRKTTSMNFAVDILRNVDTGLFVAAEYSPEALIAEMAARPAQASLFHVDEASGFLAKLSKRDYMSGGKEALMKLYDGNDFERKLQKGTYSIKSPYLVCFWATTLDRATQLLTDDDVHSGFLPRFTIAFAKEKLPYKALTYAPVENFNQRNSLIEELKATKARLSGVGDLGIVRGEYTGHVSAAYWAILQPPELDRFNRHVRLIELLWKRDPLLSKAFSRSPETCLKIAMLLQIAESDMNLDGRGIFYISRVNLLGGILLGEVFRMGMKELVSQVGRGTQEREVERICKAILGQPGIGRTEIMRRFHLRPKEMNDIRDTLSQRGMITVSLQGKTKPAEVYFPTTEER